MLRNSKDLEECVIGATDGTIGHVKDLYFDDAAWAIRYLIVNTSHWWLGHQVLLATQWIADVNWFSSNVTVNLSRKTLRDAPSYDATSPLDRDQGDCSVRILRASGLLGAGSKIACRNRRKPTMTPGVAAGVSAVGCHLLEIVGGSCDGAAEVTGMLVHTAGPRRAMATWMPRDKII